MANAHSILRAAIGITALSVLAAISGCAASVDSDISRFHKLVKDDQGRYGTYFVFIAEDKKNSLEHASYLDLVKTKLNGAGFREEPELRKADYLVFLNYSVKTGSGSSFTSVSPVMTGNSAFAKGFNSAGQSAVTTNTDSYIRTVNLRLARFSDIRPVEPIFESTLVSEGSSGQISVVMPTLIEALFKDFPGKNKENFRISTPLAR